MDPSTFVDPYLTPSDHLVLQSLLNDIGEGGGESNGVKTAVTSRNSRNGSPSHGSGYESQGSADATSQTRSRAPRDASNDLPSDGSHSIQDDFDTIKRLQALNDPKSPQFEPTVFTTWDLPNVRLPRLFDRFLNNVYIPYAKTVVRRPTDVVMFTHIVLYFATSVPSAVYLYRSFSYTHAVLHLAMQIWYAGAYTLLMHQHIHMRGVLSPAYAWVDYLFPFVLDPLMGHTWNTYYFHHVKHHHVEANGPEDVSSTIRYQRDSALHFACYVVRFWFLGVYDLSLYFYRKGKPGMMVKAASSELCGLALVYVMAFHVNFKAALFTLVIPLAVMRLGLMIGNWGQHAFVDVDEPESDFRSSITLIDVPSNRFCFNDGYHTSHHLNPLRHWREHPVAFLQQKDRYIQEQALVFRNTDYLMMTVRLLRKDYAHLAKCLVPLGAQAKWSLEERADFLRKRTRRFTEEDIVRMFRKE